MVWVKRGAFALVGLTLPALAVLATREPFVTSTAAPAQGRSYTAGIIRDEWDAPHIYGNEAASRRRSPHHPSRWARSARNQSIIPTRCGCSSITEPSRSVSGAMRCWQKPATRPLSTFA
jgi:hypothetical protein